ncbi:hypothetical protein T05_15891 [Trichinella murrelli]|uniref:Uncharacterized protein n=1 Tax=Trichinella murrelli TaxID=144512 RepID=A0A0V0SY76_9BILA|nr:hypothetical protein T05_15891 [Trichinella murrelli]
MGISSNFSTYLHIGKVQILLESRTLFGVYKP